MAGGSKEFRVEPDELKAVADLIQDLLERVQGDTGEFGSQKDFSQHAGTADITAGLANLDGGAGGTGAFTEAYGRIHEATSTTYQKMVQNLTTLEQSCRSTAEQYQTQDEQSEQTVNQTNPYGA